MTPATVPQGQFGRTIGESDLGPRPSAPSLPNGPNVVVILLDDVGFASWGVSDPMWRRPYRPVGRGGLRYNRFHVTALCSPTRASLLTGRNHHAVGMGFVPDIPSRYPATPGISVVGGDDGQAFRDAGYSTMGFGKWHLTPRWDRTAAGPFGFWPLGQGFERFYGFLHAETNQWTPNLVSDNHFVDPPRAPRTAIT